MQAVMPLNNVAIAVHARDLAWALLVGCTAALFASRAYAQSSGFDHHTLQHGVSIDIPSGWVLLGVDARRTLNEVGDSIVRQSGVNESMTKKTLIAANSSSDSVDAMVRVSITNPVTISQEELAQIGPQALPIFGNVFLEQAKAGEAHGGMRVIDLLKTEIIEWNGRKTIHFRYIRVGADGSSRWVVDQYRVPMSYGMIEAMFSRRQGAGNEWSNTVAVVIQSLRF